MGRFLRAAVGLLLGVLLLTLTTVAIGQQIGSNTPDGIRRWSDRQSVTRRLLRGENHVCPLAEPLPTPPFSIEVTARLSSFSATTTLWGVLLNVDSALPGAVLFSPDRHFYPPGDDTAHFSTALHPGGQFNRIRLTVSADQQASLAINGEVVWQGPYHFDNNHNQWALFAANSDPKPAVIAWLSVVLITPPD